MMLISDINILILLNNFCDYYGKNVSQKLIKQHGR